MQMAVAAAQAHGLAVAGVDLLLSKKGPLLLEVNSSPGLEGIEGVTGIDVAGEIVAHLEKATAVRRRGR
jgi:ribosomal protein S6--L-glutamate ligase